MRLDRLADLRQLVHQLAVDVEAASRIDDQDIPSLILGLVECPSGDLDRIGLGSLLINHGAGPFPDRFQLLDRGRAVDVTGGERDRLAFLLQKLGQLRGRGRLARPLEAGHQDDRDPLVREDQVTARPAHQFGQLFVDDLHHLLARVQ